MAPPVCTETEAEREATASYRRLMVASSFGTAIEWYDFFVYALVAPLAFDFIFFPRLNLLVGTIAVYSSFAVGFIARPLGGIFFGHFGDRTGRKTILLTTILTMGVSTTAIGLLPGYARIGISAPILLVALRFLQGFALGGESIGAVVLAIESAPGGRRGFYAAVLQASGPISIVAASLVVSALSPLPTASFLAWGWRIPFLLSSILVGVGAYMRANIEESALFARQAARHRETQAPLALVLQEAKGATLITLIVCLAETAFFYLTTIFAVGYGTRALGIRQTVLTTAFLVANCVATLTVPLFGALSDRVGRRPMLVADCSPPALTFTRSSGFSEAKILCGRARQSFWRPGSFIRSCFRLRPASCRSCSRRRCESPARRSENRSVPYSAEGSRPSSPPALSAGSMDRPRPWFCISWP